MTQSDPYSLDGLVLRFRETMGDHVGEVRRVFEPITPAPDRQRCGRVRPALRHTRRCRRRAAIPAW